MLGGSIDAANVSAADFVVAVNIVGQIHSQVRDSASGARIASVTVDGDAPERRRRFWRQKG